MMDYLSKRYHLNHIQSSGYKSWVNGIVERSHFNVLQSLFKAIDGDQKWWSLGSYSVFWAERVTPQKRMRCSLYFAITGTHPILLCLIYRKQLISNHPQHCFSHQQTSYNCSAKEVDWYKDIILKSLSSLTQSSTLIWAETPPYSPMSTSTLRKTSSYMQYSSWKLKDTPSVYWPSHIHIPHFFWEAYIFSELNRTVLHRPIAAFLLLLYFRHKSIPLPKNCRII
jgi:hypothetical protein